MPLYVDIEPLFKMAIRSPKEYDGYSYIAGVNKVLEMVGKLPFADVAPVQHGHWEPIRADSKGYTNHWNCSACGKYVSLRYNEKKCEFDYCHHCGAKMDEVSE